MSVITTAKTIYNIIIGTGNLFQHVLLLALRVYWGYAFFLAGSGKFTRMPEIVSYFTSLQLPLPEVSAYLVAAVEFVGGIMLIAGLGSRLAAVPLAITMITALLVAHAAGANQVFTNPSAFIAETPITYLIVSLVVFAFGAGNISFDYAIEHTILRKK